MENNNNNSGNNSMENVSLISNPLLEIERERICNKNFVYDLFLFTCTFMFLTCFVILVVLILYHI